jgi:hypothetical protein
VSVTHCGTAAADANGREALSCSHPDTAEILVRQIGYLPARTQVPVTDGTSFVATVTLVPAGRDPVGDPFPFPCEEWDAVEDRHRCFEALLHDVRGRLHMEMDSTRASIDAPALLDSAQAVWEQFVDIHCRLQALLMDDEDPPVVREMACRHWLTEARIGDIRQLRWRAQWRKPSN